MSERKQGAIVNLSSDTARVGSFGEAIYAASKAAVIAFSKTLAREHARDKIRVNAVCPGLVDTPLIEEMKQDEFTHKILDSIVNYIPFKRLGRPEEIAPMIRIPGVGRRELHHGAGVQRERRIEHGWLSGVLNFRGRPLRR